MNCDYKGANYKKNQPVLCKFGYVDYIVLASTIAIALGEEFDKTDLSILATFFAVLSDELALIASVEQCNHNDDDNETEDTFVPPVPDVAVTTSNSRKKKRTVIKKIKKISKK